ncbi:hypothetical protein JXR93_07800 [bacterium]|nr:hypothetical protein [bacterium]
MTEKNSLSQIKSWEWVCPKCNNISKKSVSYCKCCGTTSSEALSERVVYGLIFFVLLFFIVPLSYHFIKDASTPLDWLKIFAGTIFLGVPFLFFSIGFLEMVKEYLQSLSLRNEPDYLSHSVPEIRNQFINAIEDQDKLIKIATEYKQSDIRQEAIKGINSITLLRDFIKNDLDSGVRKESLKKLIKLDSSIDEKYLMELINSEKNRDVREVIIRKITSKDLLLKIAEKESDRNLEMVLFEKIGDPVLTRVIKRDKMESLSNEFVENLTLAIDFSSLKSFLEELETQKNESWFERIYYKLLSRIYLLPSGHYRMMITLITMQNLGTLNRAEQAEEYFRMILAENQWSFNQYLEKNHQKIHEYPPDARELLKSMYTGLQRNFILKGRFEKLY